MKIQSVALKEIFPYYNNPRDNKNAVEPTKESIKRYGFVKPIIVDKDMVIICGHTRYIAAFQLGLNFVPVIISDMDEEKAKEFRIADNKLAEKSSFDEDKLIEELKQMEIPSEMQAFFFEDIDQMINFSFEDFNMPEAKYDYDDVGDESYNDYDEQSDDFLSGDEQENESEQSDSEKYDDEEDDPADGLYQVKDVDGKKMIKVICPFCGNIEEIEYNV